LCPPCYLTQLGYHKPLKSLNSFRAKLLVGIWQLTHCAPALSGSW